MKEVFTEMDPKNIESEYLNEEAPRGDTMSNSLPPNTVTAKSG